MSTPPSTRALTGPRRLLGRPKRLLFSAGLAAILYLFTEVLIFAISGIYNHELSWIDSMQDQRDRLRGELGERRGLVLQVHPFVGYLEVPPKAVGGDSDGRLRDYDVTPYGYADKISPIHARARDKVIIGILGGSVAWSFHMHATDRLEAELRKDPAFAGKDLVFVNLAVSGYKQPQQLMTLNYMLVLGAEFDVVVNIDGFNEAVLYEAENAARHVFPAFPRSWHARVEVSGPRVARYVGQLEYQVERRLGLARGFSRGPWRYSPLCNLLWWIADSRSEIEIHALQDEYRKSADTTPNYTVEGPGWRFATRKDLHRHLVSLWKRSSIQLDNLCTANGIRYYHFLQPNLFLAGAKPLTGPEQHMAAYRDDMYRPGVKEGYPLMIQEGRDLKARGERFTDLTQMFASHEEGVYVDICHLNQAGNDMLADRVAGAILEDFGNASR
jgi:hypothetical protein